MGHSRRSRRDLRLRQAEARPRYSRLTSTTAHSQTPDCTRASLPYSIQKGVPEALSGASLPKKPQPI